MRKKRRDKVVELQNVEILEMAAEGKCVAKVDTRVIFVSGVAPGDVVHLKVTKQKSSYWEAEPTAFVTYSNERIDAFCSHFGLCGGCKWQHLNYETQLKYKHKQVVDALERIGKLTLPYIMPILGSVETQYYRNKLEFTFTDRKWLTDAEVAGGEQFERRGLGFHLPGRFDRILDIDHCYLQTETSDAIRKAVKQYVIDHQISCYNARNQTGLMRNLLIRTASTGEMMVLFQFHAQETEVIESLLSYVQQTFPEITSLVYVINPKGNDSFHDLDIHLFAGKDHIIEEMEGLQFRVGAKSFYQTNAKQALELYKVTRNFAQIKSHHRVYDLYTGTGTIAQFVAKQAKEVIGIEYVPMAIEDAKINAHHNGLKNTHFYAGDMKDLLKPALFEKHGKPDVIITDPPRAGMHEDVVSALLEVQAPRLVYVSCNPATQARDLQMLSEKYDITDVQPVDMFPQTHHVENVVALTLKAEFA